MYSTVNSLPNTTIWRANIDGVGVPRIDCYRLCRAGRTKGAVVLHRWPWPNQLPRQKRRQFLASSGLISQHPIKLLERFRSRIGRNKPAGIGALLMQPIPVERASG